MILRFIIENFASFKGQVEFNTFPSSKSRNHDNHKIDCGHATALRLGAVYGANGAGKSNLIYALNFLRSAVLSGSVGGYDLSGVPFKYDSSCTDKPTGLAIEFHSFTNTYYYHVEFQKHRVIVEELYLSLKHKDINVFTRKGSAININSKYSSKKINDSYIDVISRFIRPDMLLITFLGGNYPDEIPMITDAFGWFANSLHLVQPGSKVLFVPHLLDTNKSFADLVNSTVPELGTGISRLEVRKEILIENEIQNDARLFEAYSQAKNMPGVPIVLSDATGKENLNIISDNTHNVYLKKIVAIHSTNGVEYEMAMRFESDGTCRLIEYMLLFYGISLNSEVYVVDEIERSIHPILIKSIIRKISESNEMNGQLIFTTHESCLLDQDILRPDEIWFAQKDAEQATQLYPLSDFNIHHTANIENGYLNGRYGGIPFLSNLKDLHW
jgi:AAA15 family ATPase/GTPase